MGLWEDDQIREVLACQTMRDKHQILEQRGPLAIYGAGGTGRRVHSLLRQHGMRVDCFIDQRGCEVLTDDSIPVVRPNDPKIDKDATVVVALFNHTTDVVPVLASLKQAGFARVIPYTELFMHFSDELPAHYWLGPQEVYECHLPEIAMALSMLEDRSSRELFVSFLKFRLTGDPSCMPRPQTKDTYFPADVPGRGKPDRFIDCGAFNGDTLVAARERFGVLESVRAFEPDPRNYQRLVNMSHEVIFSNDTALIPCGVWSSTVQLRFASESSPASGMSEHGDQMVQCVALDDCLWGYRPALIKMDIEGSELEVLKGCEQMMASEQPNLAISIYHEPSHFWEIPLLIRELNSGYKYFLRSHGPNGYDTVLYARKQD